MKEESTMRLLDHAVARKGASDKSPSTLVKEVVQAGEGAFVQVGGGVTKTEGKQKDTRFALRFPTGITSVAPKNTHTHRQHTTHTHTQYTHTYTTLNTVHTVTIMIFFS